MKKIYTCYFSRNPDPGWSWPAAIARRFEAERLHGPSPGYYFEPGSRAHADFMRLAQRNELDLFEEDLIRVSGKDTGEYPYYWLTVKADRDYRKPAYMDWAARCPGDDRILCRVGGRQHRKLILDPKKSKALDIMELPGEIRPHIYVISKRLKKALSEGGFTGYRTVPCAESREGISDADLDLDASSPTLDDRAERFQLIITAQLAHPPHVGNVHIRRRCASCGAVYLFAGGGSPWLERDRQAMADFQVFRSYQSENAGTFAIAGEAAIVSARFIQMMEDRGLSGLDKYSRTPSIPHGIMPMR